MGENRIVNLADVAMRQIGDGKGFSASVGRAAPLIGSTGLGCSLIVVPPGKSACPLHRHHVWHELFVILEGEGVTRLDGETLPIRAGDVIAAPAGREAHQIINTGAVDLRYLGFSTDGPVDIIDYPDSGKISVEAVRVENGAFVPTIEHFGRVTPADYYDGEDLARAGRKA